MRDSTKFMWFLAGAVVGATVAILYAPASGEKTRRAIGRTAVRGKEALADTGRDLVDKGKEIYEKGRKVADDAADLLDRGKKLVGA